MDLSICLIGPHNSGKSSFLNAVAGELIVSSELHACTRTPTRWIFNSDVCPSVCTYKNNHIVRSNDLDDVAEVQYANSQIIPRTFTIVDMPGMSLNTTDITDIKPYICDADLVIYIMDINQVAVTEGIQPYLTAITAYIHKQKTLGNFIKLIILYNKCDNDPYTNIPDIHKNTYRLSSHLLLCEDIVHSKSQVVLLDKFKCICHNSGYKLINNIVVGYGFKDYNNLLPFLNTVDFNIQKYRAGMKSVINYNFLYNPGLLHIRLKSLQSQCVHMAEIKSYVNWVRKQYVTVDGILQWYFVHSICAYDNNMINVFKLLSYDKIEMISYILTNDFDFVNMTRNVFIKVRLHTSQHPLVAKYMLRTYGRCGSVADWTLSLESPTKKMKSLRILLQISRISIKRLIKTDQLHPGYYEPAFKYIPHLYDNFIEKIYSGKYKRLNKYIFQCHTWDSDNAPFYFI